MSILSDYSTSISTWNWNRCQVFLIGTLAWIDQILSMAFWRFFCGPIWPVFFRNWTFCRSLPKQTLMAIGYNVEILMRHHSCSMGTCYACFNFWFLISPHQGCSTLSNFSLAFIIDSDTTSRARRTPGPSLHPARWGQSHRPCIPGGPALIIDFMKMHYTYRLFAWDCLAPTGLDPFASYGHRR